jgi:hypothetical protein
VLCKRDTAENYIHSVSGVKISPCIAGLIYKSTAFKV